MYTPAMNVSGALLLHGYGVRESIWEPMKDALEDRVGRVFAPGLSATDVDELLQMARGRAKRYSLEEDGKLLVIGHSLGAVLAAWAARELGGSHVAAAVLLAPPYGTRERVPGPLLQLLLRHRLVPPALLRPRFFSLTPVSVQKEIFRRAVPEADAIRSLGFQKTWFHTALFTAPLPVPSLVICSEADRVVPIASSLEFARVLGSRTIVLPAEESVGHDDLFAAPQVVRRIADHVADFAASL